MGLGEDSGRSHVLKRGKSLPVGESSIQLVVVQITVEGIRTRQKKGAGLHVLKGRKGQSRGDGSFEVVLEEEDTRDVLLTRVASNPVPLVFARIPNKPTGAVGPRSARCRFVQIN